MHLKEITSLRNGDKWLKFSIHSYSHKNTGLQIPPPRKISTNHLQITQSSPSIDLQSAPDLTTTKNKILIGYYIIPKSKVTFHTPVDNTTGGKQQILNKRRQIPFVILVRVEAEV